MNELLHCPLFPGFHRVFRLRARGGSRRGHIPTCSGSGHCPLGSSWTASARLDASGRPGRRRHAPCFPVPRVRSEDAVLLPVLIQQANRWVPDVSTPSCGDSEDRDEPPVCPSWSTCRRRAGRDDQKPSSRSCLKPFEESLPEIVARLQSRSLVGHSRRPTSRRVQNGCYVQHQRAGLSRRALAATRTPLKVPGVTSLPSSTVTHSMGPPKPRPTPSRSRHAQNTEGPEGASSAPSRKRRPHVNSANQKEAITQ